MQQLSPKQRLQRVVDAAKRENAAKREDAPLSDGIEEADRGELIHRLCLGCWQILDARPDGHEIRMRREPPASDWPAIWARLNRQWRNRNG